MTRSRNSDFLLKVTSGTKDYRADFAKANVPQVSTSHSKQNAENEAKRKALAVGRWRGRGERPVPCVLLTIVQTLSPFGK